ncbi:MAG: phosphomannomutase/phosphoglucomutase [Zoogloeaceae bacterium]|jgi:phosphomannomutase/phosphoglucomutase|nr:phosphomannomutase/phosphoglucomutase [Zoogloeaceae bacterium]
MLIPAPEIFKAYDIRGIVDKTLTRDSVHAIGCAIGSEARERNAGAIVVARDGRLSSPALARSLADGLRASGADVVDIGMTPTPLAYFAAHHLKTGSAVMITGSHNPPEYNGFKIMLGGETLHSGAIAALRERIVEGRLASGSGKLSRVDVREAYFKRIVDDVKLARPMKIAVDCGNGVAGAFAPELFRRMGCELVELFCAVDGAFPNHHPDPSKPANLQDLIRALRETDAELGLAFDGDGDRLGVVTKDGEIIYPDRQLMLFAADVLMRHPGAQIIYDVKCSRNLARSIRYQGGEPLMWMTGHALIKAKLKETGAPLAGEMSGHTFFNERWYGFDDGLYAGARLLEIVSRWQPEQGGANWPLKHLPDAISTPELNLKMKEGEPHALIAKLRETAKFKGAREIIAIDGLRVEYPDGFGLMRASNTTPVLVLRFEADNKTALARIQADFRRVLKAARPDLPLTFKGDA